MLRNAVRCASFDISDKRVAMNNRMMTGGKIFICVVLAFFCLSYIGSSFLLTHYQEVGGSLDQIGDGGGQGLDYGFCEKDDASGLDRLGDFIAVNKEFAGW